MRRGRRRGGQIGETFAELTTPALRATPPLRALRGGEYSALCLFVAIPFRPNGKCLNLSAVDPEVLRCS